MTVKTSIESDLEYARLQLEQVTPENFEFRMRLAEVNLLMAQTKALVGLTTAIREEGARTRAYRMEVSGKLQLIEQAISQMGRS